MSIKIKNYQDLKAMACLKGIKMKKNFQICWVIKVVGD